MQNSLVSVIIPCYNQGQYLQEAVDSVLASTYKNIEIIVVDDGSTQGTKFLKTFVAEKTKIIHQENQGVAQARNNGIKVANGKYILPLDSDDKIYPTYIEKAVKVIEDNNKIGIVYCGAEFFGAVKGKWELPEYKFPDILAGNLIFNTAMYKKADWELCGGYKKEMIYGFEDWEFWINLIERGAEVYKIPEVLFLYRQHNMSRSSELSKKSKPIVMINQIIKFHPKFYEQNAEKISSQLRKNLDYFASRSNFISRVKYKICNIFNQRYKK